MDSENGKSDSNSVDARIDKLIKDLNPNQEDDFTKAKSTPQKNKPNSQLNKKEIKPLKKGTISSEEASKINKVLCEYAFSNGLTSDELISKIIALNPKNINNLNKNSLWDFISKSIPDRSIKTIYNYILNNFSNNHNNNNLHSNNIINVYKKLSYNVELSEKDDSDTSSFSLENKLTLIREINLINNIQYFLDLKEKNKIKLIKNKYEFVPNVSLDGEIFKIDESANKIKIDEVFKISKSHNYKNFFIRNIFDFTQIVNILIKNIEINWEIIGKKIKINPNQCKSDWEKIKKEYKVDQLCKIKQDIIMVKKYEFKNIFLYI